MVVSRKEEASWKDVKDKVTRKTKDKDREEDEAEAAEKGVVVMCHKQGRAVVVVESEAMVKIVSSPLCPNATSSSPSVVFSAADAAATATHNFTMELVNAGLESLSSVLSAIT